MAMAVVLAAPAETVFEEDFEDGLPGGWKEGVFASEGLPKGSRGGARAVGGKNLASNHAWVDGHFKVEPGMVLNYWARLDDPQWYQAWIFCKAPGPEAKDMNLYEGKVSPPRDQTGWQLVSIPFSEFKATTGPNKGNAPKPGEVCWSYFWGFQKRPLGMVLDKVWISRGASTTTPPPPAEPVKADPPSTEDAWAFEPQRDAFNPDALLDLRNLNEPVAGAAGWLRTHPDGDFVRGDGKPIRFWAVNTGVERHKPHVKRPRWRGPAPDIDRHARWLAKRGVNMVRCHAHINPDLKKDPNAKLTDVNRSELEWIWRTVGAMKKQGIYTTVSPYWANSMQSDDGKWGTDWNGNHHALLFFEKELQDAYKAWLKALFTTPTPLLDGKTLAEDPGLGIFQIQNEDSLLFWTIQNLKGGPKRRFGKMFADWAARRHGSLKRAIEKWNGESMKGDDLTAGVLDFHLVWNMTADGRSKNAGQGPRLEDQLRFWTEVMFDFNRSIADYVRKELKCPVLVNAGNWKTADAVYLMDCERYSYTANEVIAVNRYFGGIHSGSHRGWAIINGDQYKSDSALTDSARAFPLTLKQVKGHPMMITEGSWVFPNEYAAEAPFLVSVYSGLTGFDAYYWFATGTDEWTPPQSANGYMPSQQKWIFATPDMAGQFPAAALAFRRGYVKQGQPVIEEHRSLEAMYEGRTPILAESAGFDPNRDAGDIAPSSPVKSGADPYAMLAGPVTVVYDSKEAKTRVARLDSLVRREGDGVRVRSITGEVELNTAEGYCAVNAPRCQGVTAHFENHGKFDLKDVSIECGNRHGAVMVVPLDDQPISRSRRILVQVGTACRPAGWQTRSAAIAPRGGSPVQGKRVLNYGKAPWMVESAKVKVTLRNRGLKRATTLDMNGMPRGEVVLKNGAFTFPPDAMYVVVR
jgi:hypothetical protein